MIYSLEESLDRARNELTVTRREVNELRTQVAQDGPPAILAEQADALYRVEEISISKMLSGGLDTDDRPGDDVLIVHLAPLDADGELIKLPGDVEIEMLDPLSSRSDRTIGQWSFTAEESREFWQNGLIAAGFTLRLPWQGIPQSDTVVINARFRSADGREFRTTETIQVDPPREDLIAVPAAPAPRAPAALPSDTDENPFAKVSDREQSGATNRN
ncbi:hypothetical protein [Stratiformator vulcanicus]|uniref:hypothetical protein n=1 Tax=Stratiformator vulcanicus TaxID=2527980 RepID=UPI0028780E8B|nr:hypothetical protein [Stratiformator vulcanicus]